MRVADSFNASLIKNSSSMAWSARPAGTVILEHHDFRLPAGISDSLVISCDIGINCAIHNVRYLAYFILATT